MPPINNPDSPITQHFRLCNSVCSSKQWSPEFDPIRLQVLQTAAQDKLDARDAQALELKYTCYPSTRPQGWAPTTQPLIDTDDDNDLRVSECEDDCDYDGYNAANSQQSSSNNQFSQQFQEHLQETQSLPNPALDVMFGKTTMERVKCRAALLQQHQRRGRRRKGEKSSSGGRLPNGKMSLQINGMTLDRPLEGPTKSALKGVTERCGGLVTVEGLVSQNLIHGRIQVRFYFANNFFESILSIDPTTFS